MAFWDVFAAPKPKPAFTVRGSVLAVPAGAQRICGGASAAGQPLEAITLRVSGTQPGSWIVYVDGVSLDGTIRGGRVIANGYTQQTQPSVTIPLGGEATQPWGRVWVCVINGSLTAAGDYECSLTVKEV